MAYLKLKSSGPSSGDQGILIAIAATLLGAWMRLTPPYLAGFPINDGGLFYVMMQSIRNNGYDIPQFIPYNGLSIPFAYPPLALYLGAGLADVLRVSESAILRWMPAMVLILTIPAFFCLAETVTGSRFQAGIATLFFSLAPRSITWLIMGGGLTRSLGTFFLIMAARELYSVYAGHGRRALVMSALFCSLVVLSHPEATLHTLGIAVLFWILLSRNKRGLLDTIIVGGSVLLITSFWWARVLAIHGMGPFLAASRTGYYDYLTFLYPILMTLTGNGSTVGIAFLGFVGVAICLVRKQYLLPAWWMMHYVLEARNAENVVTIPIAILASISITDAIFPALSSSSDDPDQQKAQVPMLSPTKFAFLIGACIYLVGAIAISNAHLTAQVVSATNRSAFEWVRINTPETSRFLLLTGEIDPFLDATTEWFPALARRGNITTIQGWEWIDHQDFDVRKSIIRNLQECLYTHSPLECINVEAPKLNGGYDYIFITHRPITIPFANSRENTPRGDQLVMQLMQESATYRRVYHREDIDIFYRQR